MTTLSNEQFQKLIAALRFPSGNNLSANGQMQTFIISMNKMTRFKDFREWSEISESRMGFMGTEDA